MARNNHTYPWMVMSPVGLHGPVVFSAVSQVGSLAMILRVFLRGSNANLCEVQATLL